MRAIDTNVALRLVLRDDPAQLAVARAVFADGGLFLPRSVVLEIEWVLRGLRKLDREQVSTELTRLCRLGGVTVEGLPGVAWAIERYRLGADLADMIHLTSAAECDAFLTFDRALADDAGPDTPVPVETLAPR